MWKLPDHERIIFARNPLETVVFQLRFHPILKVPSKVADFQDAIRGRFPRYQEVEMQRVDASPPAVAVSREAAYLFHSADKKTSVTLARDSLSITEKDHHRRETMIEGIDLAVQALHRLYSPVAATRVGLRYVNIIDRDHVRADLGHSVEWTDLLHDEFLQFPLVEVDDNTRFYAEATSPREPGALTLRYGLLAEAAQPSRFRLDIDRFSEEPGAVGAATVALVTNFARDINAVFRSAANGGLLRWMEAQTP